MKKLTIFTVIIILISITIFQTGFHNTDLAVNFRDNNFDCNGHSCRTIQQLYFDGTTQMQVGFTILLTATLIGFYHMENTK